MVEIINLRQQRKAKTRSKKEKEASQNRLKFGRTKEEKLKEKKKSEQLIRHVEGHKRETNANTDDKKESE